jgi:2-haloacid dehalogenase
MRDPEEIMTARPAALVFDAYGTLFDVHSVVDEVRIYKPAPRGYQLAVDRLRVPAKAIGFVSSNGWDAASAKAFGFRTFWVNRAGAPLDPLGAEPDHVIGSLADLPALVAA